MFLRNEPTETNPVSLELIKLEIQRKRKQVWFAAIICTSLFIFLGIPAIVLMESGWYGGVLSFAFSLVPIGSILTCIFLVTGAFNRLANTRYSLLAQVFESNLINELKDASGRLAEVFKICPFELWVWVRNLLCQGKISGTLHAVYEREGGFSFQFPLLLEKKNDDMA